MKIIYKCYKWLEDCDRQKLDEFIKKHKLSITDICKANKISRSYYYDMYYGKRPANKLIDIIGERVFE